MVESGTKKQTPVAGKYTTDKDLISKIREDNPHLAGTPQAIGSSGYQQTYSNSNLSTSTAITSQKKFATRGK